MPGVSAAGPPCHVPHQNTTHIPLLLQQDSLPAGSMQSELLEAIFAHLSEVEDLACCKATSRAWRRAVPRARPLSLEMGF